MPRSNHTSEKPPETPVEKAVAVIKALPEFEKFKRFHRQHKTATLWVEVERDMLADGYSPYPLHKHVDSAIRVQEIDKKLMNEPKATLEKKMDEAGFIDPAIKDKVKKKVIDPVQGKSTPPVSRAEP